MIQSRSCFTCHIVIIVRVWSGRDESTEYTIFARFLMILCSGTAITPIVCVSLILTQTTLYDGEGLQSWMISWIVWGVLSTIFTYILIYDFDWDETQQKRSGKMTNIMNGILLITIGIDLGNTQLNPNSTEFWEAVGFMLVFPSIACCVPAAVCGFIANYFFEEKFTLKCGEEIKNDYLCLESNRGCCDVVSSYDVQNSYIFIGGLASNILAVWAICRILGYIVVHASEKLRLYVRRKK
eukprot:383377_1